MIISYILFILFIFDKINQSPNQFLRVRKKKKTFLYIKVIIKKFKNITSALITQMPI